MQNLSHAPVQIGTDPLWTYSRIRYQTGSEGDPV